jgi:hypothetical protein
MFIQHEVCVNNYLRCVRVYSAFLVSHFMLILVLEEQIGVRMEPIRRDEQRPSPHPSYTENFQFCLGLKVSSTIPLRCAWRVLEVKVKIFPAYPSVPLFRQQYTSPPAVCRGSWISVCVCVCVCARDCTRQSHCDVSC